MEYEYLEEVKNLLGITGNFQDKTIKQYIIEVIEEMKDSGVAQEIAVSKETVGVVARGVNDLWNLGNGGTTLSPYFKERVIKLSYKQKAEVKKDV